MKTRKQTTYVDGSIKLEVIDNRALEDKMSTLSYADKLAIMFPSNPVDVTSDWVEFDDHKRL